MIPMRRIRPWFYDNRRFLAFVLLLGVFRTAVADWNPIPSGSMHPNLLEGDVVFVNRLAYDVKVPLTDIVLAQTGAPQRGDVVTFFSPEKNRMRLIKRVIGLPGDTIAMRGKKLFVNGVAADYAELGLDDEPLARGVKALHVEESTSDGAHEIQWLSRRLPQDDFGPIEVPADHYLMLGDNRDNSEDSRFFGLVARENIIGRAERILVSADYKNTWNVRFSRFGKSL
jgi:signal peptidase I